MVYIRTIIIKRLTKCWVLSGGHIDDDDPFQDPLQRGTHSHVPVTLPHSVISKLQRYIRNYKQENVDQTHNNIIIS